ncbi:hypothetical protein ZEAMMB73_Zm00001d027931 [Zea mays]|uniref:Uncharacterized protein n=1 Tax=Zea mays TaxID=4577 RepID=A0A1D6JQQ1_MAIZE|nr:hypothetical protein ZEAMMB73_Zm00001d027931 [Zea mays]
MWVYHGEGDIDVQEDDDGTLVVGYEYMSWDGNDQAPPDDEGQAKDVILDDSERGVQDFALSYQFFPRAQEPWLSNLLQWWRMLTVDIHYPEGTPNILPRTKTYHMSPASKFQQSQPLQTRMKFGQCKLFNHFTDISTVLPRTLEKSLSNVIGVRGISSKHPHILAIWAHYQRQPGHIIDRRLQIDANGHSSYSNNNKGSGFYDIPSCASPPRAHS